MSGRLEVVSTKGVIIGIILLCHQLASVSFGPDTTFFYVSFYFKLGLDMLCESFGVPIDVSTQK